MPDPWMIMLYRDLRMIFPIHVFPQSWTQISMTDPNTEFEKFEKTVSSYLDKHFPEKKLSKLTSIDIKYPNGSPLESLNLLNSGTNYTSAWRLTKGIGV